MLVHEDVVVESPTGSGKTLAFLLPALTIMKRRPKWEKNELGLLIICPSRDLALQIAQVAAPYTTALNYSLHSTIGGKKMELDLARIRQGVNVLVATPGRLERLIESEKRDQPVLRKMLKHVEVLVVDEADKFAEASFSTSMETILNQLPKQRRTGLFSATQAKEKVDLAMFTLRSPAYIKLSEKKDAIGPSSLSVYCTFINADQKLMALVEFIRSVPDKKVLVFFSSCQCVQYFSLILPQILTKRKIFAVHGKNKNRFKQVEKFRAPGNFVMLSTDVMARGIDISDLDWVVHFDIPKRSSTYKKRLQLSMKEMKVKTVTEAKSELLREKIVKMASTDRHVLEAGTAAFISFIKSQGKHDSFVVCKLSELDLVGHAHAYGLLRLPKIKETLEGDMTAFKRSDIDTAAIPYRTKADEEKRKTLREKNVRKREEFKKKSELKGHGKEKTKKLKEGTSDAKPIKGHAVKRKAITTDKSHMKKPKKSHPESASGSSV